MRLDVTIVRQPLLSAAERGELLALHRRYFDGVRRETFLRDLAGKDWVIRLRAGDALAGFSTVRMIPLSAAGEAVVFLFTGDTVVERAHRKSGALAGAFGHVMRRALADHPGQRCCWFLISKGYRTYRFLPLYFQRFFPTFAAPTPPDDERRLRAIGGHLFGAAYDAEAGVVHHAGAGDYLAAEERELPSGRAADPHVRFFLARNPAWAEGDELACIADITPDNLLPSARRVIERTPVRWVEETAPCSR